MTVTQKTMAVPIMLSSLVQKRSREDDGMDLDDGCRDEGGDGLM